MRVEELRELLSSSVLPRDSSAPAVPEPRSRNSSATPGITLGYPQHGLDGTVTEGGWKQNLQLRCEEA